MVNKNLIRKSELADMAGVSRAAVNKALVNRLAPAAVGSLVDLEHPAVEKFLAKHAARKKKRSELVHSSPDVQTSESTNYTPAHGRAKGPDARERNKEIASGMYDEYKKLDADIVRLADRSLRDLIDLFGTQPTFDGWLKSLKDIEDISKKRIDNEIKLGNLLHKDLARRALWEPIENAHLQLLTDGIQTMSTQAYAKMQSGCTVEQLEDFLRKHVSKFLIRAKSKVKRALDDADRKCRERAIGAMG
jgi:hypothetical protein